MHITLRIVLAICLAAGLGACRSPQPLSKSPERVAGDIFISALEMAYQPARIDLSRSGSYRLRATNLSQFPHDLEFSNGTRTDLPPKQTVSATLEVPVTGLTFRCSLPGHEQAGMRGVVRVGGQTPEIPQARPAGTVTSVEPKFRDPRAPAALPGRFHEIELVAIEKDLAVDKGAIQNLWTYNGQVPGPVIRVRVGDTVRVRLINPVSNRLPHSVDFHASQVAWNDEMESISPGQEKIYQWRADYAGVWMYHCGTNPALHHIASGMYGMVIVDPPQGLPPVDQELALVQSEFYFGAPGQATDLNKAASTHPAPDYVTFNGVAFQYKDQPIPIMTGKPVRIFVLNAGPNEDSSFHIVGAIFNRVIKEGMQLSPENTGHWGSQAVDLAPAQGAILEFTTAEDGLYPLVTHAFNFVGKGAIGLLKAGDGNPHNLRQ